VSTRYDTVGNELHVILPIIWVCAVARISVVVLRVAAPAAPSPSPHCVAFLEENQNVAGIRMIVRICPIANTFSYRKTIKRCK
jgi:hypothetical protein